MAIRAKILEYMRTHKVVTPYDIIDNFHNYKLSTQIGLLIKEGYEIGKETVYYVKENGEKSHYKQYWLISEPEKEQKDA